MEDKNVLITVTLHKITIISPNFLVWQFCGNSVSADFRASTPNFPKNEHFLPPDTHTYVCVIGRKKCSENLACSPETRLKLSVFTKVHKGEITVFYAVSGGDTFH